MKQSILSKLLGKSSEVTVSDNLNHHSHRYQYEYVAFPGHAAVQPMVFLSPDLEGEELMDFVLTDADKATDWGKQYRREVSMKIYGLKNGQITVIRFPEPQSSPEVHYAVVPIHQELLLNMKHVEDLYDRPFYILAKVVDGWYIGDIRRVSTGKCTDDYITTYHERLDTPDLVKFVEWVLTREGLSNHSSCNSEQENNDPLLSFLVSNILMSQ